MSKFTVVARLAVYSLLPAIPLLSAKVAIAQSVSSPNTSAPSRSRTDTGGTLNEIIVTSTREREPISRVPLSVSAYSQQTMDEMGVKSIKDIARFTPGIQFDPYENHISIRGIQSDAGSGPTGIYIDDTPIQMRNLRYNNDDAVPDIFDLDRVEVLRGPQGTLFGAGSEGGTIRYITRQPSVDNWSSYARAEGANTDNGDPNYEIGAAAGGPLVKNALGFRLSAYHRTDGGYVSFADYATGNVARRNGNETKSDAFSGSLTWRPIDGLRITPAFRYQSTEHGAQDIFVEASSNIADGQFRNTELPTPRKDDFSVSSLNVQYSGHSVDFTSNTAYFRRSETTGYDGTRFILGFLQSYIDPTSPYYPLIVPTGPNPLLPSYSAVDNILNKQDNWTEELRLQSANLNDRLNWVAGIFYQHANQSTYETFLDPNADQILGLLFDTNVEGFYGLPLLPNGVSAIGYLQETDEQVAGFANLTYRIWSGLKLTAGTRYEHDKFTSSTYSTGPLAGGYTSGNGQGSGNPVTPKLGITYDINSRDLVYASWSSGFRPGGVNAPVPVVPCAQDLANLGIADAPPTYGPDKLYSWEVGSKDRAFDGALSIATSAYIAHWKGIQQAITLPICQFPFTDNLGEAEIRGLDFQASLSPLEGLTLDLTAGYTHARYTKSVFVSPDQTVVRSGESLPVAPWNVSLGAQYAFHLIGDGDYLRGDYEYTAQDHALTPDTDPANSVYDPGAITPQAIKYVSLRAGVIVNNLDVSAYVDNALDSHPLEYQFRTGVSYEALTIRPRTIGITLIYQMQSTR